MKIFRKGDVEIIDPFPMPYAYAPANREINTSAQVERVDLRTFDTEEAVKKYLFQIPSSVKDFRTRAEGRSITVYEADKKYVGVWMLDNDLVCDNYENQAAWDTEEVDDQGQPNPEIADKPIMAIGFYYKGQRYAWTYNPRTGKGTCSSEAEVLQESIDFLAENKITMLKGWNSKEWDVPYLAKRLAYNKVKFDFSTVRFPDISLAYRFMSKNFRSQWALGKVAKRLFDVKKPFVNVRLSGLSDEDLQERVLWDAEYTDRIDTHPEKQYSKIMTQMAKQGHIFPDQVFGVHPMKQMITVTPVLDQYFLKYAHNIGYVLPCKSASRQRPKYRGGIVELLQMGTFKGVLQFDVDSLYPNIILAWKLAPLGRFNLVEPIVRDLLSGKRNAKDKTERWAYKIAVNALYGIFASTFYRFKSVEVSDMTCWHGRDIEEHVKAFLTSLGYTVFYMDTDSIFVKGSLEEAETIQGLINDYVRQTYHVENIVYGLENFWSTITFPKGSKGEAAKKRYFGIVHVDKSGKVVDKFEEAGMESLRGDWCELAVMVQDAVKRFLVTNTPDEDIKKFYGDTKNKLFSGVYDPLLVMTKHMNKAESEYGGMKMGKDGKMRKIGTPQHIKALREAIKSGWVPTDMVQYGVVEFYMTKGGTAKLINLTNQGEISYSWYWSHQIEPLLWRLGVIDQITPYKAEKIQPPEQMTL